MTRLIPHPVLSLMLVGMWLLLTDATLGHLVLGSAVALVAGRAYAAVAPGAPRLRSATAVIRLLGVVAVDILRSNFAVASLIVTDGRHGRRQSGFVEVPLRIKDPVPLALLAIIVTATPGTAWLDHDPDRGVLLLHVFDLVDPDDWRRLITQRYEALLMEAFG
jgi:multicomponent K+:H+ antiporter subunit E